MSLALTLGILLAGVAADSGVRFCDPVSTLPETFEGQELKPGSYKIVFVQTKRTLRKKDRHGMRRKKDVHATVIGTLVLRTASNEDVSPTTGDRPLQSNLRTPLYGWLDADLSKVEAPLCDSEPHPLPGSRDPVKPGVLVTIIDFFEDTPPNTPVLTVATLSNLRHDDSWVDGCGIGLRVRRIEGRSFAGRWDAWGISHAGSGHFCAYPVTSESERPPHN